MAAAASPTQIAEQLAQAERTRGEGDGSLVQYEQIERQEWHLWVVSVFLMFVLGVSVLSFMFPTAFWFAADSPIAAPQRAFFGFSVLLALAMVYILQRQSTVRRLRRSLYQAQSLARTREQQTAVEFLRALPGRTQFCDSLAMEFLRASHSGMSLSVLVLEFRSAAAEQCGAAAKAICDALRPGEGLFRVDDRTLSLVLPGMKMESAELFRASVLARLGAVARLVSDVRAASFPENAKSQAELQATLRTLEESVPQISNTW